jgi:SAM-dependent methyltransferase
VSVLVAPPGSEALPPFGRGWLVGNGVCEPFLSYTDTDSANWSEELEELHEEESRTHFIDVWTRGAIANRLGVLPPAASIVDLGCSSGYLLEDLRAAHPDATLFGVDLIAAGLRKAHKLVPDVRLLQADVCALPFGDGSFDAVVSANLLEHVRDDKHALGEILRVLRQGSRAVVVVPAGPGTYDYYDRFLGHERRYARGELGAKAREVGLTVLEDVYLASLLYPAFWLVKKRNRLLHSGLEGEALARRVARDIAKTKESAVAGAARRVEETLRLRLPFGIRNLVVLRREGR